MEAMEYEMARNMTLLFFLERLLDKGEPRTVHDLSCQFGAKGFTKEMRQIAGGSQSGEFFSMPCRVPRTRERPHIHLPHLEWFAMPELDRIVEAVPLKHSIFRSARHSASMEKRFPRNRSVRSRHAMPCQSWTLESTTESKNFTDFSVAFC